MRTRTAILLLLWFVIIIIAMTGLFYLTFCTESTYYTQVDNARVSEIIPRGGMYYQYRLPAYDDHGRERELTFQTSRLLRDDAYLMVHTAPMRGVTAWEEIQPEAMPEDTWQIFIAAE